MDILSALLLAVLAFSFGGVLHSGTAHASNFPLDTRNFSVNVSFANLQRADMDATYSPRPIRRNRLNGQNTPKFPTYSGFQNKIRPVVPDWETLIQMWCFMRHTNGTVSRYLARAESREIDPWYRDDYRVAAHTVRFAKKGIPQPFERAFLHYFGKPIDKALKAWTERDERTEYELLCALPRKPAVGVKHGKAKIKNLGIAS